MVFFKKNNSGCLKKVLFLPRTIYLLILFSGLSFLVLAETIVLKTGKILQGRIIEMTAQKVIVDVHGVKATYDLSGVYSIDGEEIKLPPKIKIIAKPQEEKPLESEPEASGQREQRAKPMVQPELIRGRAEPVAKKAENPLKKKDLSKPQGDRIKNEELNRDKAEGYLDQGLDYDLEGDSEKAQDSYKKALEKDPELGRTYLDKGISDYFLGNYAEAGESLKKAEVLFESSGYYQYLGVVKEYQQKLYWPRDLRDDFTPSISPY